MHENEISERVLGAAVEGLRDSIFGILLAHLSHPVRARKGGAEALRALIRARLFMRTHSWGSGWCK